MKKFALIGASGYIAPRHFKAIKDVNGDLLAALDSNDSVGVIDSFFPKADFFVEIERFDRHLQKLKYEKNICLNYLSICTPNYLHDSHIRLGLRSGADAICEKPLVLNPWNIDALEKIEKETGNRIWNVLQLREHSKILELKKKIENSNENKIYDIDLTYITSRGNWYYSSWKGDISKSGGIATNIGVHFFDMLSWIFGSVKKNIVHVLSHDRASGYLEFKRARVRWFLSINNSLLPKKIRKDNQTTYRSIKIEGEELEFSGGFEDLHSKVYKSIVDNDGYGLDEAKSAIEIVHDIRNAKPIGLKGDFHPLAKNPLTNHPFKI
tara:strand:+ start:1349 stop:2317 length:969 start_codon:yes stop_codon:yes gene_type:complete